MSLKTLTVQHFYLQTVQLKYNYKCQCIDAYYAFSIIPFHSSFVTQYFYFATEYSIYIFMEIFIIVNHFR